MIAPMHVLSLLQGCRLGHGHAVQGKGFQRCNPQLIVQVCSSRGMSVLMQWCCAGTYPSGNAPVPSGNATTEGSSSNDGLIQDFVTRSGTRFVVQAANKSKDSCETFYFAGANTYYLVSVLACCCNSHHIFPTCPPRLRHVRGMSPLSSARADSEVLTLRSAAADDQGC